MKYFKRIPRELDTRALSHQDIREDPRTVGGGVVEGACRVAAELFFEKWRRRRMVQWLYIRNDQAFRGERKKWA